MSWEISYISLLGDPLELQGRPNYAAESVHVNELSRYLGTLGLKIDVYSRWEDDQKPSLEDYSRGTRVIRIPVGPPEKIHQVKLIPLLKDIATWIPTYQIQQGLHYNLVHTHSYLSGPVGIHLKDTWGIPLVHTFDSLSAVEIEILGSEFQGAKIQQKIEKLICSRADRIIAQNNQAKVDLIELYDVDPDLISVIPYGVNLDIFQPHPQAESRQEIAFPNDVFLITYVGKLDEQNGLDTLLKAIHLIDNPMVQAVIIGGPFSEKPFLSRYELSRVPFQKYVEMIDDYGLEKQITFTGSKRPDQLATYYSAGDVTVVPSHYEPFGMTAMEAISCGSSVIASRVGGLISIVQENRVGALFETRSAAELAEKIRILYDQPKINDELRKNTRPYAEEHFNWMSSARSVSNVYDELIKESANNS